MDDARGNDSEPDRSADDREHRSPGRVREVYDTIAEHFSRTRANPWPEVEAFLDGGPAGQCGLDVGCGNGRHLELVAEHTDRAVGVDASPALLAEACDRLPAGRNVSLLVGDAAALPVAADTVDVGLYVATLHHLPGRGARRASLDELARVLAPGGRALVSVWSTAHDRFDAPADADRGFDTTVGWTLPDGETVPRFYHIYALPEFDADLAASALATEESFVSSGNCYARVRGKRRDEPRRCQ